jgi:hypothetical protein
MPDNTYVKINGIYKRLKMAEAEHCPIYIHAVVGVGKTAAVDYYFRNRRVYRLSGLDGTLDKLTPVLEYAIEVGDFLKLDSDGKYRHRIEGLSALET